MSRMEALKRFLAEDPKDSFSRYALALEHVKLGEHDQALAEFRTVVGNNPDYVAAYYQMGQLLAELGQTDEARQVFQSGISTATRIGDGHTRSELEAALATL